MHRTHAAGAAALFVTLVASASSAWYWPPPECGAEPDAPDCSTPIVVTLAGEWLDTCVPTGAFGFFDGTAIRIDVAYDYPPDQICFDMITPWSQAVSVGLVPPGRHDVIVRLLQFDEVLFDDEVACAVTVSSHPADVDGNGNVEFADLTMLLSAWGPCGTCTADIDDDGIVGFSDLLLLLASWDACPQ